MEHHFGLLRIKCKYKNDWENILTTQSKISILRDIETDLIGSVVNKRKDTFGVDISVSTNEYGEKFGYTNRKIAYVLLKYFGFPVQYLNTRSNFCDEITLLTIFESKLNTTRDNEKRKINAQNATKRYAATTKSVGFHASNGAYIRKRLTEKIFPKDAEEKKICTLRVSEKYRRCGWATFLLKVAFRELRCAKPIITVSSYHIEEFAPLLQKNGFILYKGYLDYYKSGITEYAFNGPLNEEISQRVCA